MTRRIAVVGSGVAGLTAAYIASKSAHVTVFEADDRLGGHADTHDVAEGERTHGIDTGFIVHNPRTYPVLLRLFAELGVTTQPSEMSMSIRDDESGLEWAGALGRKGVFPTSANVRNPRYLAMLVEIPLFHRRAKKLVETPGGDDRTLREFIDQGRYSAYFIRHFMEPLVAAVWSCDPAVSLDYPARYLFTFLNHHGMLGIFGSPQWRTVTGGSREYVNRIAKSLHEINLAAPVTGVRETEQGVEITAEGRTETFDAVIIATHPGQALQMLSEPTDARREVLGAMPYSPNQAILHTDASVMPEAGNAWASWNFRRLGDSDGAVGGVTVTYDLTRLQRLDTDTHYFVTLGGEHLIDPATIIEQMDYEHPLYNPPSVAAQERLPEINSDRIAFAGAYHGWGFHEDGARSGLAAVEALGLEWPEEQFNLGHRDPSRDLRGVGRIYETTIRHTRREPFKRAFTHRSHTWLVDLDDLPDHGVLARFEARDHLGDPDRSIRQNVESFLATHDIAIGSGRIEMAAYPRSFGYCFNPISVFWCWDATGALQASVIEVHNTYGDRHAYLIRPDEHGKGTTEKLMYVSPFHGVDGRYDLSVPVPDEKLSVTVGLTTDDGAKFTASLVGTASQTSPMRAAPAALKGSLLIRLHGIWLWLRRLPIHNRPTHHQEGVL